MKYSLGISNFLEDISVFPILLFSSISLHWSLKKAFLSLLAILWNFPFKWMYLSISPMPFTSLLFSAICKASSDKYFAFLYFFFLGMILILPHIQVYEPLSIVLQALCLSDLIPWIYLSLPLYNHKGFRSYLNGLVVFPIFFNFSLILAKEFMIWATISSQSCFCWLFRASPSLAAKNIINLISLLIMWWCPWWCSLLLGCWKEGVCYDQCILLAKLY